MTQIAWLDVETDDFLFDLLNSIKKRANAIRGASKVYFLRTCQRPKRLENIAFLQKWHLIKILIPPLSASSQISILSIYETTEVLNIKHINKRWQSSNRGII